MRKFLLISCCIALLISLTACRNVESPAEGFKEDPQKKSEAARVIGKIEVLFLEGNNAISQDPVLAIRKFNDIYSVFLENQEVFDLHDDAALPFLTKVRTEMTHLVETLEQATLHGRKSTMEEAIAVSDSTKGAIIVMLEMIHKHNTVRAEAELLKSMGIEESDRREYVESIQKRYHDTIGDIDKMALLELGMSQGRVVKILGEPINVTSDVKRIEQEIDAWQSENASYVVESVIKPDEERSGQEKKREKMYTESFRSDIYKGLDVMKYHYIRGGGEKYLLLCFQDSKLILILPELLQDLP